MQAFLQGDESVIFKGIVFAFIAVFGFLYGTKCAIMQCIDLAASSQYKNYTMATKDK